MQENHSDNIYAYNNNHEVVYIDDVESGRKGYYCLGCERAMQAVKSKTVGRKSFFRHDAQAMKGQKKCTYSDETYRHKLAKEILLVTKRIKVPAVYKYPPENIEGDCFLIAESRTIYATKVHAELTFYEDLNGQICYSREIDPPNAENIIRPDITFFNKKNEPILFIEIVVSHKITDDKKVKIRHLGIDTVQVTLPRDSPEEIENTFKLTKRTQWIYNNEEASTKYVSVSNSHAKGVSTFDKNQMELCQETIKCRQVQINNLIRSIKRFMASESTNAIESRIRAEISRVESDTDRLNEQWRELQERKRAEIRQKFKEEEDKLNREEENFRKRFENLESRYLLRRSELESNIRNEEERRDHANQRTGSIRRSYTEEAESYSKLRIESEELETKARSFEQLKNGVSAEYSEAERGLRVEFAEYEEKERSRGIRIKSDRESIIERFRRSENSVQEDFESTRRNIDSRIQEAEGETRDLPEKIRQAEAEMSEQFKRDADRIREAFEIPIAEILRRIEEGQSSKYGNIPRFTKESFDSISLLNSIAEASQLYKRHKLAYEWLKNGTYKKWIKNEQG